MELIFGLMLIILLTVNAAYYVKNAYNEKHNPNTKLILSTSPYLNDGPVKVTNPHSLPKPLIPQNVLENHRCKTEFSSQWLTQILEPHLGMERPTITNVRYDLDRNVCVVYFVSPYADEVKEASQARTI